MKKVIKSFVLEKHEFENLDESILKKSPAFLDYHDSNAGTTFKVFQTNWSSNNGDFFLATLRE